MRSDLLHVIGVVSNPIRWHSRIRLFHDWAEHMLASGVKLTVVECAYGERPYQIRDDDRYYQVVRVRTDSMCWNKENLINLAIQRLPDDWNYVAWIDADVRFRHQDWAYETVQALQLYEVLQPWSNCLDLGPNEEMTDHHKSFAYMVWHGRLKGVGPGYEFCHPGYAWAARRSALNSVGGLIDFAILGSADHHMALGWVGKSMWSYPRQISEEYKDRVKAWERRAITVTNKHLGFLPGIIEHHWHGSKAHRKYIDRWQILINNDYQPDIDIKHNTFGVVELAGNKPRLTHEIDKYFHGRMEDLTWAVPTRVPTQQIVQVVSAKDAG